MMDKKNSNNKIKLDNSKIEGNIHIGDNTTINNYLENTLKFTFNLSHFKSILDLLNDEFNKNEEDESVIPKRIEIIRDIDNRNKNKKHNISQEDYENKICNRVSPYKDDFDKFYQNPRNIKYKKRYHDLIANLNLTLKSYEKNIDSILWFFCEINDKMRNKYLEELENYDTDLVTIFLCYAYFICDLDKDK